ncbi:MAG: OmpA family protein [Gammaproteobacteria bacterium]|nr:OmpA family protein [Gammaproteobacteria bacterium]
MARMFLFISMCLVGAFPATAGERHFYAPIHDAAWTTSGDILKCTLSQELPNFGSVRFNAYAGGNFTLVYELAREKPVQPVQKAVLRSEPPHWKQNIASYDITTMSIQPGRDAIIIPRNAALRALYELEQGMAPTLHFEDWVDARDHLRVSMSSVRLKEAMTSFQQCSGQLHPKGFEDVNRRVFYFKPDNIELNAKYYADLNHIAGYLKVDPSVKRVVIKGYADERGTPQYNEELSQMRVDAVRNYLLDRDIPENKLVSIYFGEMNSKGRLRDSDRRVELELIR